MSAPAQRTSSSAHTLSRQPRAAFPTVVAAAADGAGGISDGDFLNENAVVSKLSLVYVWSSVVVRSITVEVKV